MVDFANRLIASGVSAHEVKNMSRQRLAAVVGAIRGVSEQEAMDEVPEGLPVSMIEPEWPSSGDVSEVVRARDDGDSERMDAVRMSPSEPDTGSPVETVVEAPVETGSQAIDGEVPADGSEQGFGDAGLSEETQPAPFPDLLPEPVSESVIEPVEEPVIAVPVPPRSKGRWDDLDLTALGYRIEEVVASSDAERSALRITLPSVGTLRELALPKSPEVMLADGVEGQKDRAIFEKFVRRYADRTGSRISDMESRIIALLLVDLPSGGSGRQMGANGWYHGVVLPGIGGSTRVRRIVSIDQSEQAIADALVS